MGSRSAVDGGTAGTFAKTAGLVVAAALLAAGSVGAATIEGTSRADTLRGGAGADRIDGKGGNDRLYGGRGDDVLLGGRGNDLLVGGAGADTLRCGPGRDTAIRDRLDRVSSDCEAVRGPTPAPRQPQPQPQPPPRTPGAPAEYAFGSELSDAQKEAVRRGLDAAARSHRRVLGRELPPFTVWAHGEPEAMIQTYARTRPAPVEDARRLWEGAQVGHAAPRKVWLGPAWFQTLAGSDRASALKIAAHEAFHVLQYELAPEYLWSGGIDDVRSVGPWWLLEGAPEYFAYLAVADEGLLSVAAALGRWEQAARGSPAQLRALETFRGQLSTPRAYELYALAVRQLVRDRDPRLVVAYFDAVGRGVAWPDAFVSAFGRSVEAFYGEFEAYRKGL